MTCNSGKIMYYIKQKFTYDLKKIMSAYNFCASQFLIFMIIKINICLNFI